MREIAVLAKTQSVVGLIPVVTFVRELRSSVAVIAGLAESFGVERFVCVRTGGNLLRLALCFLDW